MRYYFRIVQYLSLPWSAGDIQTELFFMFGKLEDYCIKTFLGTISLIETGMSEYENLYVIKSECSFGPDVVYRFYLEDNIFLPIFSLEVTEQYNGFACSLHEFQRNYSPLSLFEQVQNSSCFVFPNPARSFIKVSCEAEDGILDCYSVNGKYICSMQEICLGSGMYDVSMLVSGMYIITTQSGHIFFVKQ